MDYDTILKIVMNKKERKDSDKICFICHFPINSKNDEIVLKCKHNYHKDCLLLKKNKKFITCPYCLTVTKYSEKKINKNNDKIKCKAILKYGKNKGNLCNKTNCKIHNKDKKCKAIIKSGKRKGETCNRIKCHYHKNITI